MAKTGSHEIEERTDKVKTKQNLIGVITIIAAIILGIVAVYSYYRGLLFFIEFLEVFFMVVLIIIIIILLAYGIALICKDVDEKEKYSPWRTYTAFILFILFIVLSIIFICLMWNHNLAVGICIYNILVSALEFFFAHSLDEDLKAISSPDQKEISQPNQKGSSSPEDVLIEKKEDENTKLIAKDEKDKVPPNNGTFPINMAPIGKPDEPKIDGPKKVENPGVDLILPKKLENAKPIIVKPKKHFIFAIDCSMITDEKLRQNIKKGITDFKESMKEKKDILFSGFSFDKENIHDFGNQNTYEDFQVDINKGSGVDEPSSLKNATAHFLDLIQQSKEKNFTDYQHCIILIANNLDAYPEEPTEKLILLNDEITKIAFIALSSLKIASSNNVIANITQALNGRYFNTQNVGEIAGGIQYVIDHQTKD